MRWQEEYPDYLGCINSLDNSVGRIHDELDKLGLAENTLIIYTSDHGSHFRTRNREYKRSCHESSIRIPMVFHGPGFRGGKVIHELVSLIDLPPSLLNAGGVTTPESFQGRPLQELVEGNVTDWPEEIFIQISESHVGRAIRTKQWKYAISAPDKDGLKDSESSHYAEAFLYDLEKDPHEKNNLIRDPAFEEIRAALAEKLKKKMLQAGEMIPVITPC